MTRLLILAAAAGLVLAACGGASTGGSATQTPATGVTPSSGAPIPGGGLSIEEALASTIEGPLMVKGYLVAPEGEPVRLCTALLESYPPQCGAPSLVVEGLELASVEGLQRTEDPELAPVTWSDGIVSLLGTVRDGVLTLSATAA